MTIKLSIKSKSCTTFTRDVQNVRRLQRHKHGGAYTTISLRCRWHAGLGPLPSNRHHRSNGDCLEGKRENYQVCSVQYCVQRLCTVQCTHIIMNRPDSSLDWVLSHWANFTVFRFILCMYVFCISLHIACCSIVTWWGGPGGIEAWSFGLLLPSVLWHCRLRYLTRKNPSPIWSIMCLVRR